MVAARTVQTYDAKDIGWLEGLAAVRKRPAMYVGGKDGAGAFRIFREIVDNCVDEHSAGFGNLIQIYYNTITNYFVIADRGRGVPVDKHERTGESALTVVFTKLHAGGKFGENGVYKNSGGLHGVGASCTNALSDSFEAWSFRKAWYYQKFSKGAPVTQVIKKDPPKPWCDARQGTIIRFHPDPEIFGAHKADPVRVFNETRDLAMLNPGLEIQLQIDDKRTRFKYDQGVMHMVYDPAQKDSMLSAPFRLYENGESTCIDLGLCWYDDDSVSMRSFVNSMYTSSGGTHVDGFRAALTKALREASGTEFESKYWMMGLRVGLHWRMHEPDYRSQTKEELSSDVTAEVRDRIFGKLAIWLKQQPGLAKKLVDRAARFRKNEERFKADNKAVKDLDLGGKDEMAIDPDKFTQADSWVPPHMRELVLVEGDSAGGSCWIAETEVQLINGETKTFADLIADDAAGIKNYGYAYDTKAELIKAVELKTPRVTKHVTELIEVELSNGRIERCTPDHLWLTEDGTYVRADQLTSETKLTVHTEHVQDDRRYVISPKRRKDGAPRVYPSCTFVFHLTAALSKSVARDAARLRAEGCIVQIHHKDFNSLDDHPSNLQALDERKHRKLHGERTRFTSENTSGELNGHARKMASDKQYHETTVARTKEYFGAYWKDDEHRSEQAARVKAHFQNPANKLKTKAANTKYIVDTYKAILSRCATLDEAGFNAARAALAAERGLQRINIRFDYWPQFFTGTLKQLAREVRRAQ